MSTDRAVAARHPAGEQPLVVYGKDHSVHERHLPEAVTREITSQKQHEGQRQLYGGRFFTLSKKEGTPASFKAQDRVIDDFTDNKPRSRSASIS
jgi:hypothetical protein